MFYCIETTTHSNKPITEEEIHRLLLLVQRENFHLYRIEQIPEYVAICLNIEPTGWAFTYIFLDNQTANTYAPIIKPLDLLPDDCFVDPVKFRELYSTFEFSFTSLTTECRSLESYKSSDSVRRLLTLRGDFKSETTLGNTC